MTNPDPARGDDDGDSVRARATWVNRRRQKIADEIARNRRGEYTVPTWVLAVALALMVGGWVALIALA